jgi:hypothetical protein
MQSKRAAPERFAAKGVEPKDLATIANKLGGVIANGGIVTLKSLIAVVTIRPEHATQKNDSGESHASTPHCLFHGVLKPRLPQIVRPNDWQR